MTDPLTHEQFSQNLNGRFLVRLSSGENVELELTEVSDFKKSAVQERFWLHFEGSAQTPLDQGTFSFENENMGTFDMFITPIKSNQLNIYYEAVFNRLVEGAV